MRRMILAAAMTLCPALPLFGGWLVTTQGARIETRGTFMVQGNLVVFNRVDGSLASLRTSEVDLEASARASAEAVAPPPTSAPIPSPTPSSTDKPRRVITDRDLGHTDSSSNWLLDLYSRPNGKLTYPVDPKVKDLSIYLIYADNPEPTFAIVDPSGRVIRPENVRPEDGVTYHHEADLRNKSFSVTKPKPGKWQSLVNGQPVLPDNTFNLSYILDVDAELRLDVDFRFTPSDGYGFVFTATLDDPSTEVRNVEVASYILPYGDDLTYSGTGSAQSLAFSDNGKNYDQRAGDRVYTSTPWKPRHVGDYQAVAAAKGELEGFHFLRQAKLMVPAFDLAALPRLEAGKTYRVVVRGDGAEELLCKARILSISPRGEVVAEQSGGQLGKRTEPFDLRMLVSRWYTLRPDSP